MKEISRGKSFIILFFIYAFASAAGIIVYRLLPFSFWLDLLIADVAATVFVYIFSVIFRNSSVYDPYWSVQPLVILGYASAVNPMNMARFLMLLAVAIWGIRLTANWAYTFHGMAYQDWRYTGYEQKLGRLYQPVNFLGIHLMPTLIVYGCTLPAVFVFEYDTHAGFWNFVLFFMSAGAVLMQGLADKEMHAFRKNPDDVFNRHGLWKYSRHPNYLGEILMWWGIGLSAYIMMPERPYLLAGALANTIMFLFVSVPLADGKQSQKPGFPEYKASTHMLLPLPFGLKDSSAAKQ